MVYMSTTISFNQEYVQFKLCILQLGKIPYLYFSHFLHSLIKVDICLQLSPFLSSSIALQKLHILDGEVIGLLPR